MSESILIVGGTNLGKTGTLRQIIAHNPDMPAHVFDGQNRFTEICQFFGGVPDNCTVHKPQDVNEELQIMRDEVTPVFKGEPDGYGILAFDMIDDIWESAQTYFSEQVYQDDPAERMMKIRTKMQREAETAKLNRPKNQNQYEGFIDWTVIKQWHRSLVNRAIESLPCHVIATTAVRELRKDAGSFSDDPRLIETWDDWGAVPTGEKRNTFLFMTLLGMSMKGSRRQRKILGSIVKDWSREPFTPVPDWWMEELTTNEEGIYDLWSQYRESIGQPVSWPVPGA
tara:strand:+ start:345 stop:1193 length:849 start_codon:yes stop_codon:yes gene_type:complete